MNNLASSQRKISVITGLLIVILTGCTYLSQPDIYQFRGVNRDGKYIESGLLNEWPDEGPDLFWAAEGIGIGYAAPSVTKDKIFINGTIDSISHLFSFDLNGTMLWKVPNGDQFVGEGFSATYPGARSTPTVVDDLVYAISGKGRIICCDANNGNTKWELDMVDDLEGYLPYFGVAESPAIDGDLIFCYPSGQKNNIVALNRYSGEKVWTTEALKDTASFCSPIFIDLPDRKIMVTMSHYYVFGIDIANGELLWKYDIEGYEAEGDHCNTPVYHDGHIYQIFGDRNSQGTVKIRISENGTSASEVWRNDRIKNNFSGFILHDDLLFTTVRGNYLKALELENGSVVDSINVATGALIFGDNKFISYGYNGEVNLVNYIDGKFEKGGSFKIDQGSGQHFSHPVLSQGILYIRHGDALMAYKIAP